MYSHTADREGETVERAWPPFSWQPCSSTAVFLGGKGTRTKRLEGETEWWYKRKQGSNQSFVLTGHPVQLWKDPGPLGRAYVSLILQLQLDGCIQDKSPVVLAVIVGLDQDKQPCIKISTCPLTAPSTGSTCTHVQIASHIQAYSLHRSQDQCAGNHFSLSQHSLHSLPSAESLANIYHIIQVQLWPEHWVSNNKSEHECVWHKMYSTSKCHRVRCLCVSLIAFLWHKTSNLAESHIAYRAEVSALFLAFT